MFQINGRLIVVQTLGMGEVLFSPGVNKSIRSQGTEQKPNSDVYQGLHFVAKLRKNNVLQSQRKSCQI